MVRLGATRIEGHPSIWSGVCAKLFFQLYKYIKITPSALNLCCMKNILIAHSLSLQTRYPENQTDATCSSFAFTKFALLSPRSLLSYLIANFGSVHADVRVQVLVRATYILHVYVYQGWKAHWYVIHGQG
jgi:hypothetical protein